MLFVPYYLPRGRRPNQMTRRLPYWSGQWPQGRVRSADADQDIVMLRVAVHFAYLLACLLTRRVSMRCGGDEGLHDGEDDAGGGSGDGGGGDAEEGGAGADGGCGGSVGLRPRQG